MAYADNLMKVRSQKLIHLTTKGRKTGRPHSVELWFAASDGKVFLSHEGKETDWMKNIKQNCEVSFEIGGENFTGKGHYINEDPDEAWRCKVALYEKYYEKATKEIIDDWFSLSTLIAIETS
ncbi:MAG: nitroreductase family deazaflavin-dependent oxidoreductase [Candidatus Bathyarchaeia archaeon]|jgi:deazaflavin-dependent oxidoreductase (nitroreductase family)